MEKLSANVFIGASIVVAACSLMLIMRGVRRLREGSTLKAVLWWFGACLGPACLYLIWVSAQLTAQLATPHSAPTRELQIASLLATGAGALFVPIVLGAMLTPILDAIERQSFSSFVGARHVRATKSGFLTVIAILSMAGVGVSSCALCSVTSIMGGFGHDLKRKILNNNAHIVVDVDRPGGFGDWETKLGKIRTALEKSGGGAATPVVGGDAMGSSASNTAGALVRGIDPDTIGTVIDLKANIEVGKFEYFEHPEMLLELGPDEIVGRGPTGEPYFKGPDFRFLGDEDSNPHKPAPLGSAKPDAPPKPRVSSPPPELKEFLKKNEKVYPGVIIGRELAKSLHVLVGDEITLLSPMGELGPTGVMPRARRFRVAAIFYSGMYEYDATHAYIMLKNAQSFFSLNEDKVDRITNIDIRVPDPEKVQEVRPAIEAAMADVEPDAAKGATLRVRDWMEMNKNLFSALKLEKIATFIILSLAIMVASFCIVCTLLLMVTEKGKEIAILKALGASDGAIRRVFMLEGVIIGAIGTVFGVGEAYAFCTGLSVLGLRLDPEVYYIDRLPVHVNGGDYAMVALAAFVICTLSTIYPAHAASELRPVDGLRWE